MVGSIQWRVKDKGIKGQRGGTLIIRKLYKWLLHGLGGSRVILRSEWPTAWKLHLQGCFRAKMACRKGYPFVRC